MSKLSELPVEVQVAIINSAAIVFSAKSAKTSSTYFLSENSFKKELEMVYKSVVGYYHEST